MRELKVNPLETLEILTQVAMLMGYLAMGTHYVLQVLKTLGVRN
ncbi:hypothetical protein [Bacillus bingmayongensis]|nr:hypothetical protein [Bacillus bingmayongensis]